MDFEYIRSHTHHVRRDDDVGQVDQRRKLAVPGRHPVLGGVAGEVVEKQVSLPLIDVLQGRERV